MVYAQSFGMGPNAQYQYENSFRSNSGGARMGGERYSGGNGMYNMQAPSTYAPVNQGGPGNPNGANNMAKPMLPRFTGGSFQNNKGPAPLAPNDVGYNGGGINPPQIPREDNYYHNPGSIYDAIRNFRNPNQQPSDPFDRYGYAGQSQQLGRYQPPMMSNPNDPSGGWLGGGGYAYNIPNSYGSGQWNQFNSTDRPNRNFGQSPNAGNFAIGNVRYRQPTYQSPFAGGDPGRSQNYFAYLSTLGQQPQQPRYTQPGTPDQSGPVT